MWNTFYRLYQTDQFTIKLAGFVPAHCTMPDLTCYDPLLHFRPEDWWDGYDLDSQLTRLLCSLTPPEVSALGANIHVSGMPERCGGILGDPHCGSSSSDDSAELLDSGLVMLSFSGGPGCIASCSLFHMQQTADRMKTCPDHADRLHILQSALADCETYMIVDDASGPDASGLLFLHNTSS